MNALIELLTRFFNEIWPFAVVEPWEASLRVRAGKWYKAVGPGLHFKLPLLDNFHTLNVVPRVVNLPHQSVKTLDGKNLAVSGALAYSISNVVKVLVEVDDHDDSLVNLAMGLLADFIANHITEECTHDAIQRTVTEALQESAEQWGVDVTHLYLTDLVDARAIRLLHDSNPAKTPTQVTFS